MRPIKRGKASKEVEFGAKGALVHVRRFLFLDYLDHSTFAEEKLLEEHLLGYVGRFGQLPPYVSMDTKYGTEENRKLMEGLEVRASFKHRGRPPKVTYASGSLVQKKTEGAQLDRRQFSVDPTYR